MAHWSNSLPELSEKQLEFLDWLVDPEHKGNFNTWADEHDITRETLYRWRKHDPRFRRAMQKRYDELNLHPQRVQEVLENMHQLAMSQGREAVSAAKTYLQYVERLEPARKPLEDRAIKDLTPEELRQELERALENTKLKAVGE